MLTLTSPSFGHGDLIPRSHTSDGANRSPPLTWEGVPAGARSLALVVEDPDAPDPAAPHRIFAHWLVFNLPPQVDGLAMAAGRTGLPRGARLGRNENAIRGGLRLWNASRPHTAGWAAHKPSPRPRRVLRAVPRGGTTPA